MMNLYEFARRIPKVEQHVHLEGAIRPAALLQLAERSEPYRCTRPDLLPTEGVPPDACEDTD
jgi:adenosine deaminase